MNAVTARSASQTRSFSTIFLIELWERFGYYGMAAILVLFMVEKLGFGDDKANLVWGAFTALVYAAPAIGGWIGDNVLGTRRTMPIGAAILAIGYLMLAVPTDNLYFLYASMGVVVVGNGLFKANAANMVRRIYEGDDAKIDSAFTLYYMAVNVGSTVSMLLTPWIKDHWGWHAGFTVCCAGLMLGLINYVLMMRTLKGIGSAVDEQPVRWDRLGMVLGIGFACVFVVAFIVQHKEVTDLVMWIAGLVVLGIFGYMMVNGSSGERAGLIAALVLMVETLLFFIFYGQMSTSLTLFALRNVDLDQHLFGMTLWKWSPGQYQALNPIWIMLLSPVLAWTYTHFGKTGRDLLASGLQKICHRRMRDARRRAQDRENGSDRDINVDIRGTVERIEQEQIAALRIFRWNEVGFFHFLGSHATKLAAPLACLEDDFVRDDVKRLLVFALGVDTRRSVVPRDQCPARDGRCNELARCLNVVE